MTALDTNPVGAFAPKAERKLTPAIWARHLGETAVYNHMVMGAIRIEDLVLYPGQEADDQFAKAEREYLADGGLDRKAWGEVCARAVKEGVSCIDLLVMAGLL